MKLDSSRVEKLIESGVSQAHVKKYGKFLLFQLTTVRSQTLKYDVINFCQHV